MSELYDAVKWREGLVRNRIDGQPVTAPDMGWKDSAVTQETAGASTSEQASGGPADTLSDNAGQALREVAIKEIRKFHGEDYENFEINPFYIDWIVSLLSSKTASAAPFGVCPVCGADNVMTDAGRCCPKGCAPGTREQELREALELLLHDVRMVEPSEPVERSIPCQHCAGDIRQARAALSKAREGQ